MGCTFVAPGRHATAEALEGISEGIYIRRMEAASVDPVSGRAAFRVTDADRILRGRLDTALQPLVLVLDARETLARIDRVAEDLTFDTCIGSCHRDGQPLAISVGAPTMRIGLVGIRS
jgi:TldD protein